MNCVLGPDNILYDTLLFRVIYDFVGQLLPCGLAYVASGFAIMFLLANGVLLGAGGFSWAERRLIGRFHNRVGPNRWGPFGTLQPMADLFKLLFKEDLTPRGADRIVFMIVPVAMVAPVILMMAVVPFAKDTALANLNVGVLYVLAVTSITSIAIFMAGWSSNNLYAMFGASRGVAVLISYEVPVVMSLLGVVLVAGSMSMADVVSAQTVPFLLVQPLAFFVFFAGTSAELNRTPFDLAEAESEIIAGYHIEYSGVKFALIQAAEFGAVLTSSAVMVTLFLSGWSGPASSYLGWAWFLMKIGVLAFVFSWIRATFPRLRIDQLLAFAWKFLLPLSIINLFATALEVYFLRDGAGILEATDLWIMAGINFGVAIGCLLIFGTLIQDKVRPVRPVSGVTIAAPEVF
ncbi:MAG: NADH-quinone oxidoreductase subunit NuoH [SAR202 cluster bacterium]|nr:NADH-quinone oxidoreductase subunit NuoH [SAR202 cluster bacterium]